MNQGFLPERELRPTGVGFKDEKGFLESPTPLTDEDNKTKALLMATKWFEENRPDLVHYVGQSSTTIMKERNGDRYFVNITVNGQKGYELFSFWANFEEETITHISK